jgi:hypothetical protein
MSGHGRPEPSQLSQQSPLSNKGRPDQTADLLTHFWFANRENFDCASMAAFHAEKSGILFDKKCVSPIPRERQEIAMSCNASIPKYPLTS